MTTDPMTSAAVRFWRDVDSDVWRFGAVSSGYVLSVYLGPRLYRLRWRVR